MDCTAETEHFSARATSTNCCVQRRVPADVEMVAYQVQERLRTDQRCGAVQGLAIAARSGLFDEDQRPRIVARRFTINRLAAGPDDDRHLFDARGEDLLENDLQSRLFHPVQVDESLQRQAVLVWPSGRNHGFANFHGGGSWRKG